MGVEPNHTVYLVPTFTTGEGVGVEPYQSP